MSIADTGVSTDRSAATPLVIAELEVPVPRSGGRLPLLHRFIGMYDGDVWTWVPRRDS